MSGLQIHSLVGRDLGNSVEIVELIGEGGMGVAYRARQHLIQRDLCIKFMQTQHIADKTWLKRFHREVTALSNLSHPHIVNVYFAGLLDGVYPYMAMEYVEGCSLKQRISSAPESRLDLRIGCRIFLQICETLDFIHNSGIVHRDLKPENILLTGEDNLFVKVLDFGICALRESIPGATLTETDLVLGSVHYMAPESFQQSQRAASVDIYAIGCMFYEALVGHPPFDANNLNSLIMIHAKAPVPKLPTTIGKREEVQLLNDFIANACAKRPDGRFSNCGEMALWLRKFLDGEELSFQKNSAQGPVASRTQRAKENVQAILTAFLLAVLINWRTIDTFGRSVVDSWFVHTVVATNDGFAVLAKCRELHKKNQTSLSELCLRQLLQDERFSSSIMVRAEASTLLLSIAQFQTTRMNLTETVLDMGVALGSVTEQLRRTQDVRPLLTNLRTVLAMLHTPAGAAKPNDAAGGAAKPNDVALRSQKIDSDLPAPLSSQLSTAQLATLATGLEAVLATKKVAGADLVDLRATLAELNFRQHDFGRALLILVENSDLRKEILQQWAKMYGADYRKLRKSRKALGEMQSPCFLAILTTTINRQRVTPEQAGLWLRFIHLAMDPHLCNYDDCWRFINYQSATTLFAYSDDLRPDFWETLRANRVQFERLPMATKNALRAVLEYKLAAEEGASGIEEKYKLCCELTGLSSETASRIFEFKVHHLTSLFQSKQSKELIRCLQDLSGSELLKNALGKQTIYTKDGKDTVCTLTLLIESSLRTEQPLPMPLQKQLLELWFQADRARFFWTGDAKHLRKCCETAEQLAPTIVLPDDPELAQKVVHSRVNTFDQFSILRALAVSSHLRGHGDIAKKICKLELSVLYRDLEDQEPCLPLRGVLEVSAHYLNMGLPSEGIQLLERCEERVKKSRSVVIASFHGLYSFRLGVSARNRSLSQRSAALANANLAKLSPVRVNDVLLGKVKTMKYQNAIAHIEQYLRDIYRRPTGITEPEARELLNVAAYTFEKAADADLVGQDQAALDWSGATWLALMCYCDKQNQKVLP